MRDLNGAALLLGSGLRGAVRLLLGRHGCGGRRRPRHRGCRSGQRWRRQRRRRRWWREGCRLRCSVGNEAVGLPATWSINQRASARTQSAVRSAIAQFRDAQATAAMCMCCSAMCDVVSGPQLANALRLVAMQAASLLGDTWNPSIADFSACATTLDRFSEPIGASARQPHCCSRPSSAHTARQPAVRSDLS